MHALHLSTLKTVQLFQDSAFQNVPIQNLEIPLQELVSLNVHQDILETLQVMEPQLGPTFVRKFVLKQINTEIP